MTVSLPTIRNSNESQGMPYTNVLMINEKQQQGTITRLIPFLQDHLAVHRLKPYMNLLTKLIQYSNIFT